MSNEAGILYVVATPLGNLGDITQRALEVLGRVDVVAAEDTRHSGRLLQHYAITTPRLSLHEHNEQQQVTQLLARLQRGDNIALISDAGTPLISDPGFRLVRAVRAEGLRVVPVPGASALICALSAAGLPTDRFVFEGFLPPRAAARRSRLQTLTEDGRTLVFYESSHRIVGSLQDMATVLGAARPAVVARELTKTFETFLPGSLAELHRRVSEEADQQKGEFVVLVQGAEAPDDSVLPAGDRRVLTLLLEELPVKQAVALAAKITGHKRNRLYELALEMGKET